MRSACDTSGFGRIDAIQVSSYSSFYLQSVATLGRSVCSLGTYQPEDPRSINLGGQVGLRSTVNLDTPEVCFQVSFRLELMITATAFRGRHAKEGIVGKLLPLNGPKRSYISTYNTTDPAIVSCQNQQAYRA